MKPSPLVVLLAQLTACGVTVAAPEDAPAAKAPAATVTGFSSRDGELSKDGTRIGATDKGWEFIEGATRARIRVNVTGLNPRDFRDGLVLSMPVLAIAPAFEHNLKPMLVQALLVAGQRRHPVIPFGVFDTATIRIPSRLSFVDEVDRTARTVDLWQDVVKDGELELEFRAINRGWWLGVRREMLEVRPARSGQSSADASVVADVRFVGEPAFENAIEALENLNRGYQASLIDLPGEAHRGIRAADAQYLYSRFHGICRKVEARLAEVRPAGLSAEDYWLQRIVVSELMEAGGGAGPAKDAYKEGVRTFPVSLILARTTFQDGRLKESLAHAREAFAKNPRSVDAYVILRLAAELLEEKVEVDALKLDKQGIEQVERDFKAEFGVRGGEGAATRRTHPLGFVLPIHEAIRERSWSLPKEIGTLPSDF